MIWVWIGIGVWILGLFTLLWSATGTEKSFPEARMYEEDDNIPTIHVFCDYNSDSIKMFYEVPCTLAELIQPDNTTLTFVECLALLVDIKENE